jgi:NADPH-dependent curcumin reductase CurA
VTLNRAIRLASRPSGEPTAENFELVQTEVRPPDEGEVVVRNTFLSVDPYMRGRMSDARSYLPPFEVGEVMSGGAVGEVVESRSSELSTGEVVQHMDGWREFAIGKASGFRRIDTSVAPASAYLGALGLTGFTAWVGLVDIAQMKEGDVVFVSGAAGGVGSLAGQIARLRGASTVIGSAGSDEKVRHVREDLGFTAAFNYKKGAVRDLLREAAPSGIDVYFDNVGGEHLEAAIGALRDFGRAALCGAISQYNATSPPPGPRNMPLCVGRRLTLRGFIVIDHQDRFGAFIKETGPWLAEGRITTRETVVDGIENMPDAFLSLFRGDNTGKMLVRVTTA